MESAKIARARKESAMKFSKTFVLIGTFFILLAACGPDEQAMETNASDQPGQVQVLPSETATQSSSTQSPTLSVATATPVDMITPTVPPAFTPTSSIDALLMPENKITKLNPGLGDGKVRLEFFSDTRFIPGDYYAIVSSGGNSVKGTACKIDMTGPNPVLHGDDRKIIRCEADGSQFSKDEGTEYTVKLYYAPGTGADFQVGGQEITFTISKSGVVAGAPNESGTTDTPGTITTDPPDVPDDD